MEKKEMKNVVTEILRSLGVRYALMIPTNDWSNDWTLSFIHNRYIIDIKVTKSLLTNKLYMSLFRYDDGKILDSHKVELADITAEEIHEVIKEFINRKEVNNMKGKRYILDIESLYQGEVVKRDTRVFETYKDLLYSVEKYIKNTYEFGKYVRYKEGNKEIVIVSDIWDYTGLILKFEGGK